MSWTDVQAHLTQTIPDFDARQGQTDTAVGIEKCLANGRHGLLNAPTGTGKSFAALVPAIEHAQREGRPVLVATETKALQDQYIGPDRAFLTEYLGIDFDMTSLKGLGNYVCRAKLRALSAGEVFNQSQLIEELEAPGHTGEVADLVTEIDRKDVPKITTSSTECVGRDCPLYESCFGTQAKVKAARADVVIINHHLLALDARLREVSYSPLEGRSFATVLPEHSAVIIDEAHGFEDVATSVLGDKFTESSLAKTGTEVAGFVAEHATVPDGLEKMEAIKYVTEVREQVQNRVSFAAQMLFSELGELVGRDERTHPLTDTDLLRLEDQITEMVRTIDELTARLNDINIKGDDNAEFRRRRLLRRTDNLAGLLMATLTQEQGELVRWVEKEWIGNKPFLTVQHAPLLVAPTLRKFLWNRVPAMLMSATLALNGDFSFIAERLGIDEYATVEAETPFDYPNQAAFFCPAPERKGDAGVDPKTSPSEWRAKVMLTIQELTRAAGGRSLLLFTSRTEMNQAWEATHEELEERGITAYRQDGVTSTRELGEKFKSEETSVLFALKSFMTGFDAKGDTCVVVFLNKLPFPVPSDVIFQARCEALDKAAGPNGKWTRGGFPKLTVPAMTLILLQAFGRLIRTTNDRGLVVVMDSRLHTKKYGKTILDSMPPARTLTSLREAVQYVQELPVAGG